MPYAGYAPQHVDIELTTHDVQAQAEGVVEDHDTIEFCGQKFRLAERVSMMPLLAFANASKKGLDSDDMEGLAAMYAMIRSVIHRPALFDEHGARQVDESGRPLRDESEWRRFESLAEDEMVDGEDIMTVVNQAITVMSARPRQRRELSSGSSPQTSERSKDGLSSLASDPRIAGLTPVSDI
jgi:hypothetical protein